MIETHKDLVRRSREAIAATKRLDLKKTFSQNILDRSKLLELGDGGDGGNEKIRRHVEMLGTDN